MLVLNNLEEHSDEKDLGMPYSAQGAAALSTKNIQTYHSGISKLQMQSIKPAPAFNGTRTRHPNGGNQQLYH